MAGYEAIGMSVAVVKDGAICYQDAFGFNPDYLHPDRKDSIKKDGLFRIASISKTFVATAVMQLVDQGLVNLDSDINQYLPFAVRNPRYPQTPITVRMLLSHRSGLTDYQYGKNRNSLVAFASGGKEDLKPFFQEYKPGRRFKYSNTGYNLLGAIIENVSKERFDRYIASHILNPLGIKAGYNVSDLDAANMPTLQVIDGDVLVCGDEMLWNGFFTCYRSQYAPMLPMMESFPILISDEDFAMVKDHLRRIFTKAGIRHGQYNVEMYFSEKRELFVIEINARQGGNNIPHLIELHSGIDFDKMLVTTAVGDRAYFDAVKKMDYTPRYITQYVVFSREAGVLEGMDIDECIGKYLIERTDVRNIGDEVVVGMNAGDSIARLVFDFGDKETQQYFVDRVEELIRPVVKSV